MSQENIPASLRRDFLVSLPTEEDTSQTLIQKLQQLYHYRHDLLHFLCETIMGLKSDFEKIHKLGDVFNDLPASFAKLSPDIFMEQNNVITFIDISVSGNFEYNYNQKKDKYQPVLDFLSSKGFSTNEFYMFWVNPTWSNLKNSLTNFYIFLESKSITFYKPSEKLLDTLRVAHESVSTKIQDIRIRTPIDALNFFDRVDTPSPILISKEESENICNKSYPFFDTTIQHIENSTLLESEELFTNLVTDPDIRNILKDEKHDHLMYNRAFEKLRDVEKVFPIGDCKPSFFIPYAGYNVDVLEILSGYKKRNVDAFKDLKKEQTQILEFTSLLSELNTLENEDWLQFMSNLHDNLITCLKHKSEKSIFNTGMLTSNMDDEILLSKKYNEYRQKNQSSMSKRTFFKNNMKDTDLRDVLPYVYRNKCLKVTGMFGVTKEFANKSGTSYRKTHTVREYQEKTTVEFGSHKSFKDFLNLLETPTDMPYHTHDFLGTESGCDSPEMLAIKTMLLEEQRKFLGLIQYTHCHSMSKHSSLAATQLLHFNELNTTDNTYCMFTSGQPNMIHVVRGGSIKRGADIGQAFFTIFLTHDKKWCNKVFGKIKILSFKKNNKTFYLCKTPWVRLTSERLSFMKDQYYSTLSTAYDTWSRNKIFVGADGFLTHMYTFRTCVSLAPSQRIAELLMDTRYIFMSALSTYSNVEKLILDKFAPPYKNIFEQFIVRQLEHKSQQVILYLAANPPSPNKPGFSSKDRLNHTLGGIITLPSLWSDFVLQDLQSIFDDIFVYVHTSKEPSSEYHEQIKAMNTILKYQKEYDSLNDNMKSGLANESILKQWLLSESQVGCSANIIYQGTKLFSNKYKGLYKSWEFKNNCQEEPLSNIVSTKSCIPEYERIETESEHTKNIFQRVVKNINSLMTSGKAKYLVNSRPVLKTFCVMDVNDEEKSEIIITKQNRVKVHDALIDWIKRFGFEKNYVIDLATWNIRNNNTKVLTDTCIKAQYGAKREFYVINLGAKAMARVTENSYKSLAKVCKNEMISIPGDKKLTFIQNAINESILSSERRQDTLLYVNGDCTKWSACETMASFISMNHGLKEVFGETIYNYNMVTFSSWANKQIQIPQTILNNLRFISDSTKYIEEGTTIKSTQNFLQGMFNYSSSIKAVIATEFALHMFKRNMPNKFLHCSHLEHSDDYSLIVRANDLETFEEFRLYHKLAQKLFGINDSIKKTNIQKHIQEFISLFSFNGQLYYPFIKKTKEVGTNLPCTDFRSDVMSITSRVSEGIRIGLSLESAYFMQRVHCASLSDAYSLSKGMRNCVGTTYDIFSRPLELFGMPDTLPILSVVVKGSTENYRIFKFGGTKLQNLIKSLFVVGQSTYDLLDLPITTIKEEMGELYNPRFSYPTRHNRIREIRKKINYSYDDAIKYFKDNLTDSLVKPVETNRFYLWLKSMYYNNSFVRAYMRVSRSAMTLRHSMFSSKPCILELHSHLNPNKETTREYTTVKNYITNFLSEHETFLKHYNSTQDKLLDNHLNCYNNCLELFYKMTQGSILVSRSTVEVHTTVNRMPDPFQWLTLENNVSNLLQFLINPENFYKDRRSFISETSLGRDIKKLASLYDIELLKTSPSYCRQIFSEITCQGSNRAYGLTFVNNVEDLAMFIRQYFEYGLIYNKTFNLIPVQKVELLNIKDGSHFFQRDWKSNLAIETGLLSQIALIYRCIVLKSGYDLSENLTNLLKINIPELKIDIGEFLRKTTIEDLNKLQSGELTRKILCFLKSRLLNDSLDLHKYVNSKFFYDVYYTPTRQVLKPFTETATITFLGIKFRAYLYIEGMSKYLFLEIKNTNRVYWFYCYSIAQRIFGLINQQILDERLLETRDFILPIVPTELKFLLSLIALPKFNPLFYKKMKNVFRQTNEWEQADLPIVVQDVRYGVNLPFKTEMLNSANVHTSDLSVFTGNIKLYKLPFGNLVYKNYLDHSDPNLIKIKIDGLSISYLLKHDMLEKFLKVKLSANLSGDDILQLLPEIMNNVSKTENFPKKIRDLNDVFDLDILSYRPYVKYEPIKKKEEEKEESNTDKENINKIGTQLSESDLLSRLGSSMNFFKPKQDISKINIDQENKEDKIKENLAKLSNLSDMTIELTSVDELQISKPQSDTLGIVTRKTKKEQLEEDREMALHMFGLDLDYEDNSKKTNTVDISEMLELEEKTDQVIIDEPEIVEAPTITVKPDLPTLHDSINTQLSEDKMKSLMMSKLQGFSFGSLGDFSVDKSTNISKPESISVPAIVDTKEDLQKQKTIETKRQTIENVTPLDTVKEEEKSIIGTQLDEDALKNLMASKLGAFNFGGIGQLGSKINLDESIPIIPKLEESIVKNKEDIEIKIPQDISKEEDIEEKHDANIIGKQLDESSLQSLFASKMPNFSFGLSTTIDTKTKDDDSNNQEKISMNFEKKPLPIFEELSTDRIIEESQKHIAEQSIIGTQLSENFLSNILSSRLTTQKNKVEEGIFNIDLDAKNELTEFKGIEGLEGDIELIKGINITDTIEAINARQMFKDYTDLIPLRTTRLGVKVSERQLDSINTDREVFAKLTELEEEETGVLFDMPNEVVEYERSISSGSSSGSDSNPDDISWYQLVPSTSIIEGAYNFDLKCQKTMLDLNEFFLKLIVDQDMEDIILNKKDLSTILLLVNYACVNIKQLNLSKGYKSIIKSLVFSLKKMLKKNQNTMFAFSSNRAIKIKNNKICFFALKAFESKKKAMKIALNSPAINFEKDCVNTDEDLYYLSAPLAQTDLEDFFDKGFKQHELSKSTMFCNLINELIPRLKKTEFKLKGSYGF